jgi:hypothetical protein
MRAFILTVAALVPLNALAAQRPIAIGIAGGLSAPQGDVRDGSDLGWHALGTLSLSSPMLPLGIRLDGAYNRFNSKADAAPSLGDDHLSVLSVTGNLSYRLPMWNSPFSPYLISGMGAYRTSCAEGPSCDGSTEFGWNIGLGTKLYILGLRSFIEARYHRTERGVADVHFIPVTFGIVF